MAMRDNLVSWWKLDEASGSRADAHGTNTLTDNNTVASATGKQSNAGDFEAGNSEYLSITDASQSGLDFSGDMTVQAWVKFESLPSTNAMAIISKMTGAPSGRAYFFGYDNGWHSGANRLLFFAYESSSLYTRGYYSWTPTTGVWYHLVAVYSSASQGSVTFYIDGTAQTTTHDNQTGGTIQNSSQPFRIGADDDGGVGRYFDGLIDEVAVWGRALSSGEVTTLYNGGSGVTYESTGGATIVNPTTQEATFTIPAYTAKNGSVLSPSAQVGTFGVPAYTVSLPKVVSVSAQVATFSIPPYSVVLAGTVVGVGVQPLTFSIPTFQVKTYALIMPNGQTLTFTLPAHTLITEANVILTPTTLTLTFVTPTLGKIGGVWQKRGRSTNAVWVKSTRNSN